MFGSFLAPLQSTTKHRFWWPLPCVLLTLLHANISTAEAMQCTQWHNFAMQGNTEIDSNNSVTRNEIELSAKLIYRPLKSTDAYYWLGFELFDAKSYLDGALSNDPIYRVPFAVKIDRKQGKVTAYAFNANLKPADKSKLSAVYDALHIRPPAEQDDPRNYLVESEDDLGSYLSRYTVDNTHTVKTRVRYKELRLSAMARNLAAINDVVINEDTARYTPSPCWLSKADGVSDMNVVSKGDMLNIHVRQSFHLALSEAPLPLNARLLGLPLDPETWQMMDDELIYPRARPKPEKTAEIFLQRLSAMDLENMASADILQYLYDNEKYIPLLKSQLGTNVFEDDFERRLFLMIGKNDSANAHTLLTDIYVDETFNNDARFRSLMALKYSQQPLSEDIVEKVISYTHDLNEQNTQLGHSGLMVLGIIAKNQLDQAFGRYLSDRIADELKASANVQRSAALLTSIANTKDEQQQNLVESFLGNESALLRERAALALGAMPNERSVNQLSVLLTQEGNPKVQTAALTSIGSNTLKGMQLNQVYTFAQRADDDHVRGAAIHALTKQIESNPEVRAELKKLTKTERHKGNLTAILDALY